MAQLQTTSGRVGVEAAGSTDKGALASASPGQQHLQTLSMGWLTTLWHFSTPITGKTLGACKILEGYHREAPFCTHSRHTSRNTTTTYPLAPQNVLQEPMMLALNTTIIAYNADLISRQV